MAYWIFKIAKQELYPDEAGNKYVYDNTHSVRVAQGDVFIYLDKNQNYSFTATGIVRRITRRSPSETESKRTSKVRTVFTAHLSDLIWFLSPLSISPVTRKGKQNRTRLGIIDVNLLGWSQSIPALDESMYTAIMDLAETEKIIPPAENNTDFAIPDSWGKTKIRRAIRRFSEPVLLRSNSRCVVCGCSVSGLVEAAHLIPYASDHKNRANPANGIALCKFCHRAFDLRMIAIQPDGELLISELIDDEIAKIHFSKINKDQRLKWLNGVDTKFLETTVQWYKVNLIQPIPV